MLALNGIMTFLRETIEYPEKCAWKHDMSSMFGRYVRVGDLILAGKQQKELESDCKHLHQVPVASVTLITGTSLVVQRVRIALQCRRHRFNPWSGN